MHRNGRDGADESNNNSHKHQRLMILFQNLNGKNAMINGLAIFIASDREKYAANKDMRFECDY